MIPKKVRVPAYHPDTPEVRKDWAQYYDRITMMDARAGANLKELAEAGLSEDTIIFYYGDHGSGMPRSKRWPYNSGRPQRAAHPICAREVEASGTGRLQIRRQKRPTRGLH